MTLGKPSRELIQALRDVKREKKQYFDKATKLKVEYNKGLEINNAENEDDEGGFGKDDVDADADNEVEEVIMLLLTKN
ncbi:high mobility group B protein 7-like [Euphorbia lathyris]|uniref:high mobility group B protein 7-like n=1 Tax=Euphorbia lathyris TaxID=212925 RepID=UPI00331317CE